ncbi:MAG: hypothetical protein HY737_04235 [Candidatus Omnitrophica bacterium]|nr:hypothetical protein [Candidatus Omnitrophota bacterium]
MNRAVAMLCRVLVVVGALWWQAAAFGAGTCTPTECDAPEPTCASPRSGTSYTYTTGTNNCGSICYKKLILTCNAPAPSCDALTTNGTTTPCNFACTKTLSGNTCLAIQPAVCGQPTPGRGKICGNACTIPAVPCAWNRYGFTVPGDADYSFPQVKDAAGKLAIPDPTMTDLVGFAAKGNIVIGDYTSEAYEENALPLIKAEDGSKTQPYVIDPTDADLGYHTGAGGQMTDAQGRPMFDGNYDQRDNDGLAEGTKLDGSDRKFYESTLSDDTFRSKLAVPASGTMQIDGVLYTNHAITGLVPTNLMVNGSFVGRDDGMIVNGRLTLNHDIRLMGGGNTGQSVVLPMSIQRPALTSLQDCPPSGCS